MRSFAQAPQPEAAVSGAADHAVLPVGPFVELTLAGLRRVVEHHFLHHHACFGVDVGDGESAAGIIDARDHQHVLEAAAVTGEQVEEIARVERLRAEIELADGFIVLDLFEAL